MTNNYIEIKGLYFSYNNKSQIYENFDFNENHNIFGLIGINGSGKSTLLKLMTGLIHPDKGDIIINNYNISKEKQKVLHTIGVLHENPKFPIWAKVKSYIKWVGMIRGLTKMEAEEQSHLFMEKLGLLDKAEFYVSELSAGLTQRFGIAQALIGIPKLVFLDEPTANLDARFRIITLELLREINKKFHTKFVIFSHILSDLERYCDGFAILHSGKIQYHNNTQNFLENFENTIYSVRGRDKEINKIKNYLVDQRIEVLSLRSIEIIFQTNNINLLDKIKNKFNITPFPALSKTEELFLNTTGMAYRELLDSK